FRKLLWLTTLIVVAGGGTRAFGQDDMIFIDDIPVQADPKLEARFVQTVQFSPEQVDQWIFNRWGGSAATKDRLTADLALRVDDIDRACVITPVQKKKLTLAGQGDIKRYYDRVDELKQKYAGGGASSKTNANTIWQDMQPLQIELLGGLFGPGSIFVKTIR